MKGAKPAWIPLTNNMILRGKNFYISYNPSTGDDVIGKFLGSLGNAMFAASGSEERLKEGEETALCVRGNDGNEWYVLEGDFRAEYEKAYPSLDACRMEDPTELDKSLKKVLNHVSRGIILCIQVSDDDIKSQMFVNGVHLSAIAHIVMQAYVANAEEAVKHMKANSPQ